MGNPGYLEQAPLMSKRFRARFSLSEHPNLVFWVCFLTLNCLLFLPLYLLNRETTTFLPLSSVLASDPTESIKQLVLQRENLDPFRLNAEILLLVALWVHVRWMRRPHNRRLFRWFFVAIYFAALCYYVYESIMLSLYQVEPVFYSHYRLLIDGIQFVVQHLQVPFGVYVVAAPALVAGVVIIGTLIRTMFNGVAVERLSPWSRIGLTLIVLLVIVFTLKYQEVLASPEMVVSSLVYKLQENIYKSIEAYRRVRAFDDTGVHQAYDYSGYDLLQKPNIYLIFVESYGSVLYKRTDFREAYTSLLGQLQHQLDEEGWYVASTLSDAPVWGGGSWMSYTSTLFGLRIDTHPQYLSLFERYQSAAYPHLGHYLKTQGYQNVRLSSLSVELGELDWLKYKNFYGVDQWLRYRDLDFQGPHYGWGPSPPDQYALYFAQDAITSGSDRPIFFFFITQNSHYPWVPLPEVVDDWRTLNVRGTEERVTLVDSIPHSLKRSNYLNAIDYELRFLTDFILKTGDDNSIFVLIGDHQPQQVSRRSDGFDTPIHIISKDAALVDAFRGYGFVRGLTVRDFTPTMRHEGFYSMFMRALLAQYGQDTETLPAYLPDGIILEDSASAN
jgi:hypothetical protein